MTSRDTVDAATVARRRGIAFTGIFSLGGRILLLGLALATAVLGAASWEIADRRSVAYADAWREADSLSLAISEHTTRTFEAVDLVLKDISDGIRGENIVTPDALGRRMAGPGVHDMLRSLTVGHAQVDGVTLVATDGRLINTSRLWPVPQVNVADRDYFVALHDAPADSRFISEPMTYRSNGGRTFFIARRLTSPDGTFLGLVLGAIRIGYLEEFYHDVVSGDGRSTSLRRSDGTMLIRYPAFVGLVDNRNARDTATFRQIAQGAELAHSLTPGKTDAVPRLHAARPLKDFPLVVTVAREQAAIDATWRPQAMIVGGGAGLTALAIAVGALLLARQVSRREASETALAATLEHVSQGIMMVDADRRIPVCNTKVIEMLDLPAALMAMQPSVDELVRHQWQSGEFGPEGTALDEKTRRFILSGGVSADRHAYERRRPNGTVITVQSIPLPDGGIVRTYTDVTEAREREAALKAAEAELRRHRDDLEREVTARTQALVAAERRLVEAIETIPEGFLLCDAQDRIVLCNSAYRRLYGMTRKMALPGTPFEEVVRSARDIYPFHGDEFETWLDGRLAAHRAAGADGRRFEQRLANGRWIEVQERRTADGGIVGLRVDVTEAREREAAEGERQKLAALGQLAGGVAHEINNLLQPALSLPALVRDRLPESDQESRDDLEAVIDGARRARDIVRSILLYARKEEPVLVPLALPAEISAAVTFVRGVLPPTIALREEAVTRPGVVVANKTQLTQVMTNLIINAGQAMKAHGTIRVILDEATLGVREAEALELAAGRYYTVAVADDGCGMDAATQSRIFEPFFTTKPIGQGTGLGLSVVYGILRSWNGAIAVESAPGQGTTFTLYIPASDTTPENLAREPAAMAG